MKTFKQISEDAGAVATPGAGLGHPYPKGSRHKDFTDKHVVTTVDHPVATDAQFKGTTKKKKRLADYEYDNTDNPKTPDIDQSNEDNEDAMAYEEVVITDETLEEDFIVITDEISDRIADLYESLSDENRELFDELLETDEGFDQVLHFVNEYDFEYNQDEE